MKKLVFLVCSNGYGHYKRCLRVANKVLEIHNQIKIDFICNEKIHKIHSDWILTKKMMSNRSFNFINGNSTIELVKKNSKQHIHYFGISWVDKKIINNADLVISDNISSFLIYRSDIVLMGSFLWSELIKKNKLSDKSKFENLELSLIKKYRPEMIALKDMAMPYVMKYTRPFLTSWIVDKSFKISPRSKLKNILIIGGGTGYLDYELSKILKKIDQTKYNIFTTKKIAFFLDSDFKYKIFGFNHIDFKKIDLIIGRPGIGTLTDCVTYSIPIFGVGEPDNLEIQHNLSKIESSSFGFNISLKNENINLLIEKIQSDGSFQHFQKKLINKEKNGLSEIANFITKKIYDK
jgi:hypothetical protein